jgi:hypothetical protein
MKPHRLLSILFCLVPAIALPMKAQVMGTTTLTVNGAVQSLLFGRTPANFSLPSGWTLVGTQDFESTIPSNQQIANGTIDTTNAHSGSKSLHFTVLGNGNGDELDVFNAGSFTDLYISSYEFLSTPMRLNDEFYIHRVQKTFADGNFQTIQNERFFDAEQDYNATKGRLTINIFGTESGANNPPYEVVQNSDTNNITGAWVQWESWIHLNTSGQNDGFVRIYLNGQLAWSYSGSNRGTLDMSNALVAIQGYYTREIWTSNGALPPSGTCAPLIESQSAAGYSSDQASDPCSPGQHFDMWIDDAIIMKK